MNFKNVLMVLVIGLGILTTTFAQDLKIGYANIEGLIAYMPATKSMNQELASYEKKLAESLQPRQAMLQQLYSEYQQAAQVFQSGQGGTENELQGQQQEIVKLEEELQKKTQEAQQKLMTKRQDLMEPILDQVRNEIDKLANEKGYTYIFNAVDGSGSSIILHGPEADNLTRELAKRLGIDIPEEANLSEN